MSQEDRALASRMMTGKLFRVALALIAIMAGGAFLLATPKGLVVTSDSVVYFAAAENLLSGHGLSWVSGDGLVKPMTHFPPLYPLALAGLRAIGIPSTLDAARWLGALLFSAVILLVGLSVYAETLSGWGGIAGAAILVLSPITLSVFSMAMSEPLYLALSLSGLLLLSTVLKRGDGEGIAAAAGLLALAYLTRYVGLALVATGLIAIMANRRQPLKGRLSRGSLFVFFAAGPIVAWMVRNALLTGVATNRRLAWHPPSQAMWKRPLGVLWEWLLPFKFSYPALWATAAALGIGAVVAGVMIWRRRKDLRRVWLSEGQGLPGLAGLHLLYILGYSVLIALSLTLLDASTPIDLRITSPVYVSLIIVLAVSAAGKRRDATDRPFGRWWLTLIVVLLVASYAPRTLALASGLREQPGGMNVARWQEFSSISMLRELPAEAVIYADDLQALYFYTGRWGFSTPIRYDQVTASTRSDYERALEKMTRRLREDCGVLVLFRRQAQEGDMPPTIIESLAVVASDPLAEVYAQPSAKCEGSSIVPATSAADRSD